MRELALAEQRGDWDEVAAIAEHDLMDRHKAIAAWQHVLARDPSDLATHSELARLYRVDERWMELADLLEHQLELIGNVEAQRTLLGELVAIYRDQLGDEARATQLAALLAELGDA
jgi:golgin subfamily B member 1